VTAVYKYGNESWDRIKENFCRLLERLNFICHGMIVKTFMYIASIEKTAGHKLYTPFCRVFKLNCFFLIHCDDILRGKDTLQKFGYNLVIASGTVLAIKLYELTRFLHFVIRHVEALSKQAHKLQ
jgi:hypothetical protein